MDRHEIQNPTPIKALIMFIRPIHPSEINAFATFSDCVERNEKFLAYLTKMWNEGYIRPERCFVAEEANAFIGRIVYWTLPSLDNFFEVDFLEVPWNANYLEVGTQLLQESLALLHPLVHAVILYVLDTPYPIPTSSLSASAQKRMKILEQFGFSLTRETYRFEWQVTPTEVQPSERLVFRTLNEVGEDTFINAIARVSENCLDRALQRQIEELGIQQYARDRFKTLKAFKHKPEWWQLAYSRDGSITGLIVPAENDGGAIVGYLGVVPEYRGQGYVNDLLAQVTLTLLADGATRIRADADVNNIPMISAFHRAGYRQFASRRECRKRHGL